MIVSMIQAYLQGWEEFWHDQCWFVVSQFGSNIPSHSEVGVLVYGTGYEASQVFPLPKDVGEAVGEAGRSLYGWEGYFANVVWFGQAEDGSDHVHCYQPAEAEGTVHSLKISMYFEQAWYL